MLLMKIIENWIKAFHNYELKTFFFLVIIFCAGGSLCHVTKEILLFGRIGRNSAQSESSAITRSSKTELLSGL